MQFMKHFQTESGMRLDEFLEATREQPFDLINGERKLILPDVFGGSLAIRALFMSLHSFVSQHKRRKAIIYAPHLEHPLHLTDKDSLDGGDVIPGFRIELAKLFT